MVEIVFYFQMSAMTTGFSAFSPRYQSIANRMCRLNQSKSSSNMGQIRPNSALKVDNRNFLIETRDNSAYRSRHRVSPSSLVMYDQHFTATGDQFAGQVGRNNGIKKYNQRQLRDIGEGRAIVHLKTEGSVEGGTALRSIDNWTAFRQDKMGTPQIEIVRSTNKHNCNMIPGRIYRKDTLKAFFE